MRIIVACGGTGGHAFPGLAAAEELRSRGHDVTVWVSGRNVESSVMKSWDGEKFSTLARPLSVKNVFPIVRSFFRCRRELMRAKPDALLAMGSYSSLPPVLAARSLGIATYLHEANTVPGRAVEILSRFANAVAISFDETAKYLPGVKTVKTGLPVRKDIENGKRFNFIPSGAFVVFITGGSQGAHAVNELMTRAMAQMKAELDRREGDKRLLYVIHQSGVADEGRVIGEYARAQLPCRVHAFEHLMADAFASADIVVARAGASTLFELAQCGKASLLIPLPSSMRNHQHHNADAFAVKGAADEGVQQKLTPRQLSRYLLDRYDHPEKIAKMAENISAMATPNAARLLADMVVGA
jgi:UDP-N-acetylglucosamine--N-acetylmuramyl-(pentapeptide) pyrophosphoryl-undecaprenol N-acetylglucosamine transferase